jgi:hypothetical protein
MGLFTSIAFWFFTLNYQFYGPEGKLCRKIPLITILKIPVALSLR